jgi:hypothetical protein
MVYTKSEIETLIDDCWDMASLKRIGDYVTENKYKYCLNDLLSIKAYWEARIAVLILFSQMPK